MDRGDKFVIALSETYFFECEYIAPHHYPYGVRHDFKIERVVDNGKITGSDTVVVQAANLDAYDWRPVELA